jgi:SAM-dependent methyltransferase
VIAAGAAPRAGLARGLSAGHFRRVADRGFGDPSNSYPYSCAFYDGHVYIGTNRDALTLILMRAAFEMKWAHPPVPVPKSYSDLDIRGQIWRHKPGTPGWERVYRSPMVQGYQGNMAPLAYGFRCMVVFQGRSDPRPAIYTIPAVGRNAPSAVMLRSGNGTDFEVLRPPAVPGERENFGSFRALAAFKGRIWAAPASVKADPSILKTELNLAQGSDVRCSDDPASGRWSISSLPGFGDPGNLSIIDMLPCGNHLYAGTLNVREGFQLWRTDGEGPPPHRWEKVLDRGADRGPENEGIPCLSEFQGDLYLASSIQNGGHDRVHNIGPAAGEVIRVHEDKTWDLVVGQPRFTRQGFKVPTSGLGPGFENRLAGYLWRMVSHDGNLYVGTFDLSSLLPYTDWSDWPESTRRTFDPLTFDQFMTCLGGCELWRTADGDHWVPVTRNGFQNPYNFGVRALLSTPSGLFVGMANPFGPQVAVKGAHGWRFEENPRGGLEVFHGALAHRAEDTPFGSAPPRWRTDEARADVAGAGQALIEEAVGTAPSEEALRDALATSTGGTRALFPGGRALDPLLGLELAALGTPDTVEGEVDLYFGLEDLRNVGYWRVERSTPAEACRALVEELLAPLRSAAPPTSILVIGAGGGTIAAECLRLPQCGAVTVAAFDRREAKRARQREPRARVLRVKEARPFFGRAAFDVVLWVEGPGRRDRRRALVAARVALRQGGRLLAADLVRSANGHGAAAPPRGPLDAVERYAADLREAGFGDASVIDATRETWWRFFQHSREHFKTKWLLQEIDPERQEQVLEALPGGRDAVEAYLLVSAIV